MTMTNTFWKAVALIALVVAILALGIVFFTRTAFGATIGPKLAENYDPYIRYNNGFYTNLPIQAGLNATPLNRLNFGTCFIQPYATTIAASTTAIVDCQGTAAVGTTLGTLDTPLTGVTAGDSVTVALATSSASTIYGGLDVDAASASSTPGYIQLYIVNGTGGTFTWPTTGTASGTLSYHVMH